MGNQWKDNLVATTPQPPSLDRLTEAYIAIRDARAARKRLFEEADAQLELDQTRLRAAMLAIMNATGGESIRTAQGTVIRSLKTKPSVVDWQAVYDFIMADPARFEMLEKRVKATFVKDYLDETGAAPPGVNIYQEYEISVRRPTSAQGGSAE